MESKKAKTNARSLSGERHGKDKQPNSNASSSLGRKLRAKAGKIMSNVPKEVCGVPLVGLGGWVPGMCPQSIQQNRKEKKKTPSGSRIA